MDHEEVVALEDILHKKCNCHGKTNEKNTAKEKSTQTYN